MKHVNQEQVILIAIGGGLLWLLVTQAPALFRTQRVAVTQHHTTRHKVARMRNDDGARQHAAEQEAQQRAKQAAARDLAAKHAAQHDARQVAQSWIQQFRVGAFLSEGSEFNSKVSLRRAAAAIQNGEDATGALDDAEKSMNEASRYLKATVQVTGKSVPPGWDDVEDALNESADDMSEYESAMSKAIETMSMGAGDDDRDAAVARAEEYSNKGNAALAQAAHLARLHYVDMGGNPNDVTLEI